jgi:thiol-disulfide isomerase/thioredoxin
MFNYRPLCNGQLLYKNMKKILLLTTFIIFAFIGKAQDIKFTVAELPDTTIFLAKYFGEKLYYADTTEAVKGTFHFDGAKHPSGVYAVILPGPKVVQFINDNEKVDMELPSQKDIIGSMKVNKSINNTVFYDYIRYMTKNRNISTKKNKDFTEEKDAKKKDALKNELNKLNETVLDYQKKLAKEHAEIFVGKMVAMTLDIELPEIPKDKDGNIIDSSFLYNYNVSHYWDNVDLTNEDMIRTPAFHSRLVKYYSNQVMVQIPDSITKYTGNLISKTTEGGMVFQYIIHFVTNKYERSEIMGMDKVFVYMADNYYCPKESTKAFWMSDENLTKVCERADKIRPLMIGAFAPRLILTDTTEKNWIDIYKINAEYKILYFWDPNCGHCKKVTPKLQDLYTAKFKERGIEVIAIGKATGDDFEAWKKYIVENNLTFTNIGLTKNIYNVAQEDARAYIPKYTTIESLNYTATYDIYSTPRIFILDKNNKIMFKQLSISQLEEILDHLQGFDDAVKMYPKGTDDDPDDATSHE